ncbi:MAG: hypothetical protein ACI4XN_13815 [Candidatus Kurthia intestinigallinarum]
MTWRDPVSDPPEENTNVLVVTSENKFKIAKLCRGKWDTYHKVVCWCDLPAKPQGIKNVLVKIIYE